MKLPSFACIRVHSWPILFFLLGSALFAQPGTFGKPLILRNAGLEQKMGARVPLDTSFNDESGRPVTLRQYTGKPIILALVYYQCPSMCNMILNGIVKSVKGLKLTAGNEYDVVAVSFDPRETPEMAAAKRETYLAEYKRPGSEHGWHFLTGNEAASKALADSVGFRFAFDTMTNQYVHPSAIMILTGDGRVTRYFYGIEYNARDVRLGLVEASEGRIGTPVDQVLLYCFHYDPSKGKYGLVIMNVLRIAALATLAALLTFMLLMFRRDFRGRHSAIPASRGTL